MIYYSYIIFLEGVNILKNIIDWLPIAVSIISLLISFFAFKLSWVNTFNDYYKVNKKVSNELKNLIDHIKRSDLDSDDDFLSIAKHLQKLENKYECLDFAFKLPKSDLDFEINLRDDLYELYHLLDNDKYKLENRCKELTRKYKQKLNRFNKLIFWE